MADPGASPRSVILYLHGGAWTLGWTNIHRRMVAHLCRAAACRALAVDYRLAQEHTFPAALRRLPGRLPLAAEGRLSPREHGHRGGLRGREPRPGDADVVAR